MRTTAEYQFILSEVDSVLRIATEIGLSQQFVDSATERRDNAGHLLGNRKLRLAAPVLDQVKSDLLVALLPVAERSLHISRNEAESVLSSGLSEKECDLYQFSMDTLHGVLEAHKKSEYVDLSVVSMAVTSLYRISNHSERLTVREMQQARAERIVTRLIRPFVAFPHDMSTAAA